MTSYEAFIDGVAREALRPDGVLPPGWMVYQPRPLEQPWQSPRLRPWLQPPPYDSGWETTQTLFVAAILTLTAVAIALTIG